MPLYRPHKFFVGHKYPFDKPVAGYCTFAKRAGKPFNGLMMVAVDAHFVKIKKVVQRCAFNNRDGVYSAIVWR